MADVRASDAERNQTIEHLRDAAGEGRLTFEELADRLDVAGTAATRAELERLTEDLPAPAPGRLEIVPVDQSTVFGDLRRSGPWTVPEASAWKTFFGDVVLDLREARVAAAETTIDARSFFGDIDLLVPEGVVVEVRSRTRLGGIKQVAGDAPSPGAPRIVLVGGTVFGDVKVRAKRLSERLVERFLAG